MAGSRSGWLLALAAVAAGLAMIALSWRPPSRVGHPGKPKYRPLPSPLCWSGGKVKMAKMLARRIPPHRVYVEPFFGAGHLFWRKQPAEGEVINDIDGQLMDFYRYLREAPGFTCDMTPDMARWRRLRQAYRAGETLDPCDFLYLVKYAYGCKSAPDKITPNPAKMRKCAGQKDPSACMVSALRRRFPEYKRRLAKTRIHSRDWEEVVRAYDSPETFFYLDPPYVGWMEDPGACSYVSCDVSPERLAHVLRGLKGKWMVTYDDHPRVREAFDGFTIERVGTEYELQKSVTGGRKPVVNLIIKNY